MVFDTIRNGFPDAKVIVLDNGSIPLAKKQIRNFAKKADCVFVDIETSIKHWQVIEHIINHQVEPFVILDPDVVFWSRCDHLDDALISGRLIPTFNDPAAKCFTLERLHTSFLKVNDAIALRDSISDINNEYPSWNPIQPQSFMATDGWVRHDTAGVLYASIKDKCHAFTHDELDLYDHLFCGCHIDWVSHLLGDWRQLIEELHQIAKRGDIGKLRGSWRLQQSFFESMMPTASVFALWKGVEE